MERVGGGQGPCKGMLSVSAHQCPPQATALCPEIQGICSQNQVTCGPANRFRGQLQWLFTLEAPQMALWTTISSWFLGWLREKEEAKKRK